MNAIVSDLDLAVEAIKAGECVAFPTETVYGLGADATDDRAVARIFALKGRPAFNPLITHVADGAAAFALGRFNAEARKLAEAFWPGPLTLVVPRVTDCPVSLLCSAGLPSLALRVPAHPLALALIRGAGAPIAAPSANPSGRLSPTTAAHVRAALGPGVSVILDGGPSQVGMESTVIGCMGDAPALLRPGGLTREQVEEVLGRKLSMPHGGDAPQSPGQLESHYAPRAPLRLNAVDARPGERRLGFGPGDPAARNLSRGGDLVEAAANLFRLLHALDAEGSEPIAVAPVPEHGLGLAINDRLRRAAASGA